MKTGLFALTKNDFVKGAVTAVFAAVITILYSTVSQPGFDVFSADWAGIVNQVIQISMSTFLAYITKNFITTDDGKIAGVL